ncbi:hypothetical protein M885DRAFT_534177 [Pelagophyceae sp. CCMP2097]|nr:hypothetical protein M885DRAFT_534177 [Pelagophyceae sp. CCMP2097]|mmetsp:Transcript_6958/g.24535  ORF Transcript_6958/g.24535 Transcript_6958/m.24535 type:complete len:111 (+) Transcript_6958:320-652(+)
MPPLHDFRAILRHVRGLPGGRGAAAPFRAAVASGFRAGATATDADERKALLRRARDYAVLVANVAEQKRLRGLDQSAEDRDPQDAIRRSTIRAGMLPPTEYVPPKNEFDL